MTISFYGITALLKASIVGPCSLATVEAQTSFTTLLVTGTYVQQHWGKYSDNFICNCFIPDTVMNLHMTGPLLSNSRIPYLHILEDVVFHSSPCYTHLL